MKIIEVTITGSNNRIWIEDKITIPDKCRFKDLEDLFYHYLASSIEKEIDDEILKELKAELDVDEYPTPC